MTEQADVTVIGAGLAGMSACIHLAEAGLRVLCIDAGSLDNNPVGESLDWSAPALLKELGLPMEHLLGEGIATYKRHVVLKLKDGSQQEYTPGAWLGKPPSNVNLRTLHVDRGEFDGSSRKVHDRGVKVMNDRVVRVETEQRFVKGVLTANGDRVVSRWFLDASGSGASLFPRVFRLPAHEYGPHKVAIWDYFDISESIEGTTIHADAAGAGYMDWVWQIPIRPGTSVWVMYVAAKQSKRHGSEDSVFGRFLRHNWHAFLTCETFSKAPR